MQALAQGSAEACNHTSVLRKPLVGLCQVVAARQRDDANHLRVSHQGRVQVSLFWKRQLEDHLIFRLERSETLHELGEQQFLNLGLVLGGDVYLRLQNWNHSLGDGALTELELLCDQFLDAFWIRGLDLRSLLGAPDALGQAPVQHFFQAWVLFHHLDAISRGRQADVTLQKRHHLLLFPQVLARGHTIDITIDSVLEQDGANDLALLVSRICHDLGAQVVHFAHHLGVILVVLVCDAIGRQGLWAGAATLVKGRNETCILGHLLQLLLLYCVATHLTAVSRSFRGCCDRIKGG